MRALAVLFALTVAVQGQSVRLVRIASGFSSPTEIAFAPGDSSRMFVVEQRGRIRVVQDGVVQATPLLDLTGRVSCCGEQGLLGLAFASNDRFYVYYTDPSGNLTISRFEAGSETVIAKIPHPDFQNHNGGHLAFDRDGYLYAGTGDGGSGGDPRGNAQNRSSYLGKLLRFSIERDNNATPEIWALGLRNPWKYSFDARTGDLFIADVGQDAVEEINYQAAPVAAGLNYGWNRLEGSQCYNPRTNCDRGGVVLPVFEYPHSVGISVTGGYVYRGKSMPQLDGAYLYADYARGQIWALRRNGSNWTNELLVSTGMQISTFGQDKAGEIYVGSYGEGAIYRIAPASPSLSVVNAASFGEGIVAGSLASVFGAGIAPVVGILPSAPGNVSVTMNGTRAPVFAAASVNGQEQLNIQVPWEVAGRQSASLIVTVNGQALPAVDVPLTAVQPEIFAAQQTSPGYWTLWATGLGPVTTGQSTGQPAPLATLVRTTGQVRVRAGGRDLNVTFAGLAPGYAGLYQINVEGIAQPGNEIALTVDGVSGRVFRVQPE